MLPKWVKYNLSLPLVFNYKQLYSYSKDMFSFLKNISPFEWGIIALILLFIFGRKTFISIGKTSGESLKELKKIKKNFTEAVSDDEPPKKKKEVSA